MVYTGTPALTSRGFVEEDFVKVAEYFDAAVNLAVKIKAETKGLFDNTHTLYPSKTLTIHSYFILSMQFYSLTVELHCIRFWNESGTKLKDFLATIEASTPIQSQIANLRHEVEEYAKQFPTIGFEKATMKYKNWKEYPYHIRYVFEYDQTNCVVAMLLPSTKRFMVKPHNLKHIYIFSWFADGYNEAWREPLYDFFTMKYIYIQMFWIGEWSYLQLAHKSKYKSIT